MSFDKKQRRVRLNIDSFDEKSMRRSKWYDKQNYRDKDRFRSKKSQAPVYENETNTDSEDFG